jgi:hypothetical protein
MRVLAHVWQYRNVRKRVDVPHRIENAMKVLSFSILIQLRAKIPLENAHKIHVKMAPMKCAITPLIKRPKKLPAIANTSMYNDKLSEVPSLSLAYVGM